MRNVCHEGERGFLEGASGVDNMKAYEDVNFKSVVQSVEKNMNKKVFGKGFIKYLNKRFGNRAEPITDKEMTAIYKKMFGFKDLKTGKVMTPFGEKMWLATKIGAVLNNKPHIAEAFYYQANQIAGKYIDSLEKDESYTLGRTEILNVPIPHIEKFPIGAVKEMAWMLNDFFYDMEEGDDIKYYNGYFGNLQMEFSLTRKAARKTSNPWFIKYMRSVITKPAVEQALNRKFMVPADLKDATGKSMFLPNSRDLYRDIDVKNIPYAKKGKSIKYSRKSHGVNTIYNQVIPISFKTYFQDTLANESELLGIVHLFQQGRLFIRKDGSVWVRNQKEKTGKFYKDSGEPIYKWSGSEPYVMNDQNQNVNFTKEMKTKKVWDKEKKADKWVIGKGNKILRINSKPINKFNKESQLTELLEISNGMQSIFRAFGINVQSQMETQSRELQKVMEDARASLSKEQFAELNEMFNVIFEDDALAVHGLNKFELNESQYFPTKYTYAKLVKGLGDALIQLETKIAKNTDILTTDEIKKSPEKFSALRNEILDNRNTVHFIEEMQKSLADESQPTDGGVSKNPIFAQNYLKHFKSVSHLIDIKNARLDELVFQDYIDETSRSLNRRSVAINLIEAYANSYDQPKLQDLAMNLFKMTYQFPDAKGSILGFQHTDAELKKVFQSGIFKHIKGGKFDVNETFRNLAQFNAASLLSGPADGLVNLISSIQDAIESGSNSFLNAFSDYERNTAYWEDIAENKGGIITFQKFIENYVDRGLRQLEINEGRALQEDLKKQYKAILKDINTLKPSEITSNTKKHYQRVKRDIDILAKFIPSKTKQFLQTAAKYAITHKIEYSLYEKDSKKWLKDALSLYHVMPSIALTEKRLRTVSFIIGYKNAEKYLKGLNPSEDDLVAYAREYVFQAQFALETNLAGTKGGTALSKLWYNISFFNTQKTGWELDGHKAWFSQYRDNAHLFMEKQKEQALSGKNFDKHVKAPFRAYANVLSTMFSAIPTAKGLKKKREALKKLSPIIGRGELMFLTFGMASAVTNLALFANPLIYAGISGFRRLLFQFGPWRTLVGLNSKLYSAPIALAATSYFVAKSVLTDDEEDDENALLEIQKGVRNFTGVAGSDAVTTVLKTGDIVAKTMQGAEPASEKLEWSFQNGLYGGIGNGIVKGSVQAGEYIYDEHIEPITRSRPNVNYTRRGREF